MQITQEKGVVSELRYTTSQEGPEIQDKLKDQFCLSEWAQILGEIERSSACISVSIKEARSIQSTQHNIFYMRPPLITYLRCSN